MRKKAPPPILDCFFCGRKFRLKRDLESHINTHTKERPFDCDQCEEAFHSLSVLHAHKKTKHFTDRFKCGKCQNIYSSSRNLRNHLNQVHKVKSKERKRKITDTEASRTCIITSSTKNDNDKVQNNIVTEKVVVKGDRKAESEPITRQRRTGTTGRNYYEEDDDIDVFLLDFKSEQAYTSSQDEEQVAEKCLSQNITSLTSQSQEVDISKEEDIKLPVKKRGRRPKKLVVGRQDVVELPKIGIEVQYMKLETESEVKVPEEEVKLFTNTSAESTHVKPILSGAVGLFELQYEMLSNFIAQRNKEEHKRWDPSFFLHMNRYNPQEVSCFPSKFLNKTVTVRKPILKTNVKRRLSDSADVQTIKRGRPRKITDDETACLVGQNTSSAQVEKVQKMKIERLGGDFVDCPYCGRAFITNNINAHLLVHTGEKPFPCKFCALRFRQKSHLIKHIVRYHRYGHSIGVPRKNMGIQHLQIEDDLSCAFCGKILQDRVFLEKHLLKGHSDKLQMDRSNT